MRKYFEKVISNLTKREANLTTAIEAANTVADVNRLRDERDAVRDELSEARAQLAALPAEDAPPAAATNQRSAGVVVASRSVGGSATGNEVPVLESRAYQEAFREFVCRGTAIPADLARRAAEVTTVADGGVLVPTTIMKELIKRLDAHGELYRRVRKINIAGGVEVPILALKPVAKWVGEGASESQKIQAKEKVSFSYFGIEVKIAQTVLANIVTLDLFNNQFVELAVEAIIAEVERCIVNGDGNGKPLGILNDPRIDETHVVEMTEEEVGDWAAWKKKVFAKMGKAYRKGIFLCAQGTWDGNLDCMMDSVGQIIGKVNYGGPTGDGGESYRFGGKEVLTVEDDVLPTFDAAAEGEAFMIFVLPTDYAINSNMNMTTEKWRDPDTNQIKNKAQMVVDGKMLDVHGVIIIKKKAAAAAG